MGGREFGTPYCSIPWSAVEPYDKQAQVNHGCQTLEQLAARGGLSAGELHLLRTPRHRWPAQSEWPELYRLGQAWVDQILREEGLLHRALELLRADPFYTKDSHWRKEADALLAEADSCA
jgi:hypothetical protein